MSITLLMKMKGKSAVIIAALFTLTVITQGQEKVPGDGNMSQNLSLFTSANPFEDIFLHTDRESYAAGETIRLTAWLFSYPDLRLAAKDSYAYCELLDFYGNPVAQATIALEGGTGTSTLSMPDTLATGSYLLRAYTGVMKNFMPYGCFMKKITVANPFREKYIDFYSWLKPEKEQPLSAVFFPEGGTLVNGILTKVGVTLLNRYGYPVKCNGSVVTGKNEIIGEVFIDSTGIGSFDLLPARGENYFVLLDETGQKFALPDAVDSGYGIRVSGTENPVLSILLNRRNTDEASYDGGGFIIVQSRGRVIYKAQLPTWKDWHEFRVPVSRLTPGINDIAFFGPDGKFITERYVFINVPREESLSLSHTEIPGRREEVTLDISLPERAEGRYAHSAASVSIAAYTGADVTMTAPEYMLLGSEFRHASASPGITQKFPFMSQEARNTLLLGIKSVWIDWEKIASGGWDYPMYHSETDGMFLYVSPAGSQTNTRENPQKAFMTSWGKEHSFQYAEADHLGRFVFFLEKKNDPSDLLIRMDNNGNPYRLAIESRFSEARLPHAFPADTTPMPAITHDIRRMTDRYQISKIYDVPAASESRSAEGDSIQYMRFYGEPDQELVLDDYVSLSSMREIFFELVKRLVVRNDRREGLVEIWDPALRRSPALFIDQVPEYRAETIMNLDPAHVRQIDIITGDYLLGDIIFPGILNVVTREGRFRESPLPAGALRTAFRMEDPVVSFPSPSYPDEAARKSRIPDFRNTLYWNGNLRGTSEGRLKCSFDSSDDAQTFLIIVNATTPDGRVTATRSTITLPGL